MTITLPDGVDANAVTAQFPVLKYNKKFIFTYTADDGPVGAYGKVWSAVNKKWVDDEKYYHIGQAKKLRVCTREDLGLYGRLRGGTPFARRCSDMAKLR